MTENRYALSAHCYAKVTTECNSILSRIFVFCKHFISLVYKLTILVIKQTEKTNGRAKSTPSKRLDDRALCMITSNRK